jgi:tetratricopeptide (TPR) repeat protein
MYSKATLPTQAKLTPILPQKIEENISVWVSKSGEYFSLILISVIFIVVLFVFFWPIPTKPGEATLLKALEFASAIQSDPKDRAKAQESIVMDLIQLGALEKAQKQIEKIDGWRRGVASALMAEHLAKFGKSREVSNWIQKAESFRKKVDGWEGARIDAHISRAYAALGEVEKVRVLAGSLAFEEGIKAQIAEAIAQGSKGNFDQAMAILQAFNSSQDYETSWWRTQAYTSLSRETEFSMDWRRKALDAAYESAKGIGGWKCLEALLEISSIYHSYTQTDKAREIAQWIESQLLKPPLESVLKAPLLPKLAGLWAVLGEFQKSKVLLEKAREVIPLIQDIDKPAAYASLAESYHVMGDHDQARHYYEYSLESAGRLVNARPRALAAIEICRSFGRQKMDFDHALERKICELQDGLGAPW